MRNGKFQDRLYRAIQIDDELNIHIEDHDNGVFYALRLTNNTKNYGRLTADEYMAVSKATPGKIIAAIEKAKEKIETTVQMMLEAQGNDSE